MENLVPRLEQLCELGIRRKCELSRPSSGEAVAPAIPCVLPYEVARLAALYAGEGRPAAVLEWCLLAHARALAANGGGDAARFSPAQLSCFVDMAHTFDTKFPACRRCALLAPVVIMEICCLLVHGQHDWPRG